MNNKVKTNLKILFILILSLFLVACNKSKPIISESIVGDIMNDREYNNYYMKTRLIRNSINWYENNESIYQVWNIDEERVINTKFRNMYLNDDMEENINYKENTNYELKNFVGLYESGTLEEYKGLKINKDLLKYKPVEEFKSNLEEMRMLGDIEILGEEKINGFKTYHIRSEVEDVESVSLRDKISIDMWFRIEDGLIVKTISSYRNRENIYEVLEFKENPKYDKTIFTIPDAEIVVYDMEAEYDRVKELEKQEKIDVEELPDNILRYSFDDYKIEYARYKKDIYEYLLDENINYYEIYYREKKGEKAFSIFIEDIDKSDIEERDVIAPYENKSDISILEVITYKNREYLVENFNGINFMDQVFNIYFIDDNRYYKVTPDYIFGYDWKLDEILEIIDRLNKEGLD